MAKKKKEEQEYIIPDHVDYDLGVEILKTSRRSRRARRVIGITSFVIAVFIIISYLGYTLGQYFASATTLSVKTNSPDISLASIGFRLTTPIDSSESSRYNLQPGANTVAGSGHIYWTNDTVSSETLAFILEHEKHASRGVLKPVTARSFDASEVTNEDIRLYDRPKVLQTVRHIESEEFADSTDYMRLDILFQLLVSGDNIGQVAVDNFGVYFTRDTKFTGSSMLLEAMRISIESPVARDIISPGRKLTPESGYRGGINVGGRLDLDGSMSGAGRHGFYDYTTYIDVPGEDPRQRYEIAYGDFEGGLTNANWGPTTTESGTIPENNDSHTAATFEGVRPLINATPKRQEYTNFQKYTRINNVGDPLAYTNEFGIAEFKMQIWIEGWDRNSGEKLEGSTFGADLKFEVSKKDLAG